MYVGTMNVVHMNKKARSVFINMIVMVDYGNEAIIRSFKYMAGKIAMVISIIRLEGLRSH